MILRVHTVQLCYNPVGKLRAGLERPGHGGPPPSRGQALLYEAESVRRFAGLRLSDPIPDESTILHFRHLLERHQLGQGLFEEIKVHLAERVVPLREGTIVDATIHPTGIEAPSSTKNRSGERDPEMHQVKKGNQYHFGTKLHTGVDEQTGMVHTLVTTPGNVHDVTEAHRLLHGGEKRVWGDAGYTGVQKRRENLELDVDWRVALKPGKRKLLLHGGLEEWAEKRKASIRAKSLPPTRSGVEHPFLDVKRHFGYAKVRHRGLAKNTERLAALLEITNLMRTEKLLVT